MKKKITAKFWENLIETGLKIEIHTADLSIVTKEKFKELRNDLKMTQAIFANIYGVSNKAIEKWEQGANPIQGPAARLTYLFIKDHSLVERLYKKRVYTSESVWNKLDKDNTDQMFQTIVKMIYSQTNIINDENKKIVEEKFIWKTNNQNQLSLF